MVLQSAKAWRNRLDIYGNWGKPLPGVPKPSTYARLRADRRQQMFKSILVPIDLADTDLAKPAIATAATLSSTYSGTVRLLNVLPMTPVMLAEYVPPDFDVQQRQTSEEALVIVARESGIEPSRITTTVRQ